jgi:hypothetical protein
LVDDLIDSEAWADIEKPDALEILTALTEARPVNLWPADVSVVVFALDAWWLSGFGPKERKWNQYLDQILAALESAVE